LGVGTPKVSVFACLLDPRHKNVNHETSENVKEHIRHTVKSLVQNYEKTYEKDQGQITKNTTAMDILYLGKLTFHIMNLNSILLKFI